MKYAYFLIALFAIVFLAGCAEMPKRDPRDVARDCPIGQVQVCEGADTPTRPGSDTPVYERCRCESVM